MNIKVMYHSSTGNTEKLAQAIAGALNVQAQAIGEGAALGGPVDLLFVGDGIYAGRPNRKTVNFINGLDASNVKNVAVFGTYGGQEKIGDDLRKMLADKGLHVVGEPYACKGQSWIFLNRKHPNEEELNGAVEYAKRTLKKAKKNLQ